MDDKPIEDQQKVWLLANRKRLQNENIPIENILDLLVDGKVLDPRLDDFQNIFYSETPRGKIRALVDVLLTKPPESFPIFVAALKTLCPHTLAKCTDPPEVFRQFDSEMRTHFRALDEEEMMAFSWLERTSSRIKITDYLRHLAVIDKRQSEAMAAEKLASSAKELERQQLLHSRPDKIELVELENIFGEEPECDVGGATPSDAHVETLRSKATSGAAVLGGKEADVPLWKTQPRKRVGVYGAAGCGKTASLMKLACLYARGKLWHTRFRSFLFWKLREHNVARAETFEQLLKELPFRSFSSSSQKCKDFAEAALACDGRGLLVVLDGIDELDTSLGQKSFVRRLLEGKELREACVLVTSRPCTRARNFFKEYDVNLELLGFREEQVAEFILQRLGPQTRTHPQAGGGSCEKREHGSNDECAVTSLSHLRCVLRLPKPSANNKNPALLQTAYPHRSARSSRRSSSSFWRWRSSGRWGERSSRCIRCASDRRDGGEEAPPGDGRGGFGSHEERLGHLRPRPHSQSWVFETKPWSSGSLRSTIE